MEDVVVEQSWIESLLFNGSVFWLLMIRFLFNLVAVYCVARWFYYPKSRRRDYFFTFMLISVSIFLMIFLLESVKLKVGFALGLFAIFGIIRYRKESMPVREMTYLFVIIAMSVINALAEEGFLELLGTNLLFIICVWLFELNKGLKHIASKLIRYDKIELIVPEKENMLLDDLRKRTGLDIVRVEVGHVDFLRDTAMIKVYYKPLNDRINTVDHLIKFPKEETI